MTAATPPSCLRELDAQRGLAAMVEKPVAPSTGLKVAGGMLQALP